MTRTWAHLVIVLVSLSLLFPFAGCLQLQEDNSTADRSHGRVSVYLSPEVTPAYSVSGEVFVALWNRSDVVFSDVQICLYGAEGSLLNSTTVSDFSTPSDEHEVEVTTDRRPRYVVVDHPGFREYRLGSGFIVWTNDSFRDDNNYPEGEIQGFDYQPPERPGTCGATS